MLMFRVGFVLVSYYCLYIKVSCCVEKSNVEWCLTFFDVSLIVCYLFCLKYYGG